jgi:hypothetical protein
MANKYDRQAALAYARKYWNVVCSDGYIALDKAKSGKHYRHCPGWTFQPNRSLDFSDNSDSTDLIYPYETAYSPNFKDTIEWSLMNDCAHFLSCCIGSESNEKGGGLTVKRDFPQGPYGTLGADNLVNYLTSVVGATMVGPSPHEDLTRISKIAAGDVVAYFKPPSAQAGGGRYAHVALYLGDNKIACHTYSRSDHQDCKWDNKWHLRGGSSKPQWQWSLLKMP